MKLYRFTAVDAQRAIYAANQALGAEALIYSTRKIPNGVEVLAGLPQLRESSMMDVDDAGELVQVEKLTRAKVKSQGAPIQAMDTKIVEGLKMDIQNMYEKIQDLSGNIEKLRRDVTDKATSKYPMMSKNFLRDTGVMLRVKLFELLHI